MLIMSQINHIRDLRQCGYRISEIAKKVGADHKTIRKVTLRKFRKMIYANHFDKDYLEIEQKKTLVENKIELALKANDLELAKVLSKELESLIKLF